MSLDPIRRTFALLLLATTSLAADRYVDPANGLDTNSGTAPADAWKTIAHAVAALGFPSSDTIHLLPGTYSPASGEQFPIWLQGQYLVGDGGPAVTIVEGAPVLYRAFGYPPHGGPDQSSPGIRGIRFRGASSCAIEVLGTRHVMTDCVVEDCSGDGIRCGTTGGESFYPWDVSLERVAVRRCARGIWVRASPMSGATSLCPLTTTDCDVEDNASDGVSQTLGGGPLIRTDLRFTRTRIVRNGGNGFVGTYTGVDAARFSFDDCLIAANGGIGLYADIHVPSALYQIRSTTIARNAGIGLVVRKTGSTIAELSNLVVAENVAGDYLAYPSSGPGNPVILVTYSDVVGAAFAGANGNISADPQFVDAANGDYRLRFGSPCIDAGDPAASATTDLAHRLRPIDGDLDTVERRDMGCLEHAPLQLVTSGRLGSPLRLESWGPAGASTAVRASRFAPVAPTPTPFGEYDLAASFALYSATIPAVGPAVLQRPIPNTPALLGRTFSFQGLCASGAAPQGQAYTNVESVLITP